REEMPKDFSACSASSAFKSRIFHRLCSRPGWTNQRSSRNDGEESERDLGPPRGFQVPMRLVESSERGERKSSCALERPPFSSAKGRRNRLSNVCRTMFLLNCAIRDSNSPFAPSTVRFMGRILVADDQDAIRRWLARELVKGG